MDTTKERKRGSGNPTFRKSQTNAEVLPTEETVEAPAKTAPMTLGEATKRETKNHRRKAQRNKVQKAK